MRKRKEYFYFIILVSEFVSAVGSHAKLGYHRRWESFMKNGNLFAPALVALCCQRRNNKSRYQRVSERASMRQFIDSTMIPNVQQAWQWKLLTWTLDYCSLSLYIVVTRKIIKKKITTLRKKYVFFYNKFFYNKLSFKYSTYRSVVNETCIREKVEERKNYFNN